MDEDPEPFGCAVLLLLFFFGSVCAWELLKWLINLCVGGHVGTV